MQSVRPSLYIFTCSEPTAQSMAHSSPRLRSTRTRSGSPSHSPASIHQTPGLSGGVGRHVSLYGSGLTANSTFPLTSFLMSSKLQESLYSAITINLYRVGDLDQSIYLDRQLSRSIYSPCAPCCTRTSRRGISSTRSDPRSRSPRTRRLRSESTATPPSIRKTDTASDLSSLYAPAPLGSAAARFDCSASDRYFFAPSRAAAAHSM